MTDSEALPTSLSTVMDDPNSQAIARVYAEAFLKAAADSNDTDTAGAVETLTSFVDDVLGQNASFRNTLLSNVVGKEEKQQLLGRVVGQLGAQILGSFLGVVASHERLEILPAIADQARRQFEKQQGRQPVKVRSAAALSEEQLQRITGRLRETLSIEPVLETEVDPSLLGGLVIQVGDTVHDSSLRGRMKQLRDRLRERSHHEVQRARDRFSS